MKLIEVKLDNNEFVETGNSIDFPLEIRMSVFGSNDGWCDDLLLGHVGKDHTHFRISFSDEDDSKLDDFWTKESLSNDKFRFLPLLDENKASTSTVSKKMDLEKFYASFGLETTANDELVDKRIRYIDTSKTNCWDDNATPATPKYFANRFTKGGSKQTNGWNESMENITSCTSVCQQNKQVDVTFKSNETTWTKSTTTVEITTESVHLCSESNDRHMQQNHETNQFTETKEIRDVCQNQQIKEKVIETTPKNETELVPFDGRDVFTKQSIFGDIYRRGSKDVYVLNELTRNVTLQISVREDVMLKLFRNLFRTNNEKWFNSITGLKIRTVSVHHSSEFNGRHERQTREINQSLETKEIRDACHNQQRKEKEIETKPNVEPVTFDFTDVSAIQTMYDEQYKKVSNDKNVENELRKKFTSTSARKEKKYANMTFDEFQKKFWSNFKTWHYSVATLEKRIASVSEFLKFDGLGPYEKYFEEIDVKESKNEMELVSLDCIDVFAIQRMYDEQYKKVSNDKNVENELRKKFTSTSARKEKKYANMTFDEFQKTFWSNFKTWHYSVATLEKRIASVSEFLKFDGFGPYEKYFEEIDVKDESKANNEMELVSFDCTSSRKKNKYVNMKFDEFQKNFWSNFKTWFYSIATFENRIASVSEFFKFDCLGPYEKYFEEVDVTDNDEINENKTKIKPEVDITTTSRNKTEIYKLWKYSRSKKTLEIFEQNIRHLWKNSKSKLMQFATFTFVINQHLEQEIAFIKSEKDFQKFINTLKITSACV